MLAFILGHVVTQANTPGIAVNKERVSIGSGSLTISSPTPTGFRFVSSTGGADGSVMATYVSDGATWTRWFQPEGAGRVKVWEVVKNKASGVRARLIVSFGPTGSSPAKDWMEPSAGWISAKGLAIALDSSETTPPRFAASRTALSIGMVSSEGGATSLPREARWSGTLFLGEEAARSASRSAWENFGAPLAASSLPQSVPFAYSAHSVYSFGVQGEEEGEQASKAEDEEGPWWTGKIGDDEVGCPNVEDVDWGRGQDSMRAAWGMMWWGKKLGFEEWRERAEQLVHLTLARPTRNNVLATSFSPERKKWRYDSSIDPYHTAYWLVRWCEDFGFDKAEETREAALKVATQVDKASFAMSDWSKAFAAGHKVNWDERLRFLDAASRMKALDSHSHEHAVLALKQCRAVATKIGAAGLFADIAPADHIAEAILLGRDPLMRAVMQACRNQRLTGGDWAHPVGQIDGDDLVGTSVSLMRVGAALQDRALFERGVLALKADLWKFFDPFGTLNKVFPNPDVPFCTTQIGERRGKALERVHGFEHGEGQLAANLAEAVSEFGGAYRSGAGWSVGFDGCRFGPEGSLISSFGLNRTPFAGEQKVEVVTEGRQREEELAAKLPSVSRIELVYRNGRPYVEAVVSQAGAGAGSASGQFSAGNWSAKATISARGFEAPASQATLASVPVRFDGVIGEKPVACGPVWLSTQPPSVDQMGERGWSREPGQPPVYFPSLRRSGQTVLSTADDGTSQAKQQLKGLITSAPFFPNGGSIQFSLLPSTSSGLVVELRDSQTNELLESAKPGKSVKEIRWQLASHGGRSLCIKLVDRSKTGSVGIYRLR
ncbi:MAG: hypothetical protein JSS66_02570 [Armatimonadetes bacterium]|nr:hypothetical protein [Armatimonadota bacterium]